MESETRDEKIAKLAEAAEALTAGVYQLSRDTGGQLVSLSKQARTNRRVAFGMATLIALNAGLSFYIFGISQDVDRAQKLTRSQVLCPLYQQFVNADTPAARDLAARSGQDLTARDNAFRVIHKSYDALKCAELKRASDR